MSFAWPLRMLLSMRFMMDLIQSDTWGNPPVLLCEGLSRTGLCAWWGGRLVQLVTNSSSALEDFPALENSFKDPGGAGLHGDATILADMSKIQISHLKSADPRIHCSARHLTSDNSHETFKLAYCGLCTWTEQRVRKTSQPIVILPLTDRSSLLYL